MLTQFALALWCTLTLLFAFTLIMHLRWASTLRPVSAPQSTLSQSLSSSCRCHFAVIIVGDKMRLLNAPDLSLRHSARFLLSEALCPTVFATLQSGVRAAMMLFPIRHAYARRIFWSARLNRPAMSSWQ